MVDWAEYFKNSPTLPHHQMLPRNIPTIILVLLVFSGCFSKEDKPLQTGTVSLGALKMVTYDTGNPSNGKTEETTAWSHVLKSQAVLKIINTKTLDEYFLNYDPNDFSGNYQLSLPYGDYTFSSEIDGSEYENYLPYLTTGSFRLNAPTLKITLQAESPYGLITVENSNIEPNPVLVDSQPIAMNLLGGYYYKYVLKDKSPVLEIIESVFENTIQRSITVLPYKHYNYMVRISDGSGKIIELIMTDFELIEEELLVNIGTVPTTYTPTFVSMLAEEVNESSALASIEGKLYTINDAEKENIIYQIEASTGAVIKRVRITNAVNTDWESLAQSESHLYIGDFGNNYGNRQDLTILKMVKNQVQTGTEVSAEKIFFTYADQTSFATATHNNNFDCEAFFFANDSLHLFTKNWVDGKTKYYTLSSQPGNHIAKLKGEFPVNGLITAADINPLSGDIVMLGYENPGLGSKSFVWLFSGYPGFDIFNGKNSRINIGSPATLGQTEGIVINKDNSGFISSEKIQLGAYSVASQLYKFDFKAYF